MDPCIHVVSESCSRNRDSSDQAGFFQSLIVHCWCACVNCSLSLLFLLLWNLWNIQSVSTCLNALSCSGQLIKYLWRSSWTVVLNKVLFFVKTSVRFPPIFAPWFLVLVACSCFIWHFSSATKACLSVQSLALGPLYSTLWHCHRTPFKNKKPDRHSNSNRLANGQIKCN